MANEFDKTRVASGALPVKHFPMQAPSLTSNSFMTPAPVFARELAPNHHGSLVVKTFARMAPMPAPVLGQARINNRAFFVRFASVWKPFYNFKSDTPFVRSNGQSSIPSQVPTVSSLVLAQALSVIADGGSPTNSDFNVTMNGATSYWTVENPKARSWMRILNGLGYPVLDVSDVDGYVTYSALPLLCYARLMADWYYPSAYANLTYDYLALEGIISRDYTYQLSSQDVSSLLEICQYSSYDSDYFTSAWDNPVSPNTGAFSQVTLNDLSMYSNTLLTTVVANNGTPYLKQDLNTNVSVATQYSLSQLEALSIYMKRHQLAGARSLDRWLADFGLSIRADKLNRSIYLGSSESPLQFGDVMSHADTSSAALGSYAGKGVGYSEGKKFDFDAAEDFGMLIVVQSVVPSASVPVNVPHSMFHFTKFDFYDGTFDGRGTQPINSIELFGSHGSLTPSLNNNTLASQIFGFTQRYAEYKILLPSMSGVFAHVYGHVGMDNWHLFRLLNPNNETDLVHSVNYLSGEDSYQYDRVFNSSTDSDNIFLINWFDLDLYAPMRPLWDDYIFHDQDTKSVDIETNGVKLN